MHSSFQHETEANMSQSPLKTLSPPHDFELPLKISGRCKTHLRTLKFSSSGKKPTVLRDAITCGMFVHCPCLYGRHTWKKGEEEEEENEERYLRELCSCQSANPMGQTCQWAARILLSAMLLSPRQREAPGDLPARGREEEQWARERECVREQREGAGCAQKVVLKQSGCSLQVAALDQKLLNGVWLVALSPFSFFCCHVVRQLVVFYAIVEIVGLFLTVIVLWSHEGSTS